MQHDPDTFTMVRILGEAADFEQSLGELGDSVGKLTLLDLLLEIPTRSGLGIAEIADMALLSKSYTYQVFNGVRNPGRNAVLCIARVLGADLQQTRKLLKLAHKGDLYPRIRRDAAIIFGIQHNYSLMRLEKLLLDIGEVTLLRNS
mgnify:FL=1